MLEALPYFESRSLILAPNTRQGKRFFSVLVCCMSSAVYLAGRYGVPFVSKLRFLAMFIQTRDIYWTSIYLTSISTKNGNPSTFAKHRSIFTKHRLLNIDRCLAKIDRSLLNIRSIFVKHRSIFSKHRSIYRLLNIDRCLAKIDGLPFLVEIDRYLRSMLTAPVVKRSTFSKDRGLNKHC